MLGWLGMLLPWIVVLLLWAFPSSISATYYKPQTITPFMIILGSAGLLLISYKGYDKVDDWVNTFAGIFGIGVCLFPCWSAWSTSDIVGTFQLDMNLSNKFHCASAIIFFALLSINSLFLFTKAETPRKFDTTISKPKAILKYIKDLFITQGETTKNKKIRNIIFRVCGIGMIASFGIMLLPYFYIRTWLVETIALFFFGISFLTKANCYKWLFCD